MPRSKPPVARLCELKQGDSGDFFALLVERTRHTTREGKPYYNCRFRDAGRSATYMVWADGEFFPACEADWKEGQHYKIRADYGEHERYGPQIDVKQIRAATDDDRADGFDPLQFVERSRFDLDAMFAELRGLAEAQIADEPLRKLVLLVLDRHADRLKRIPATQRHFFPFAGGWLEHTLSVSKSC